MPSPDSPAPWWHDFHDDLLAQILLDRTSAAEVDRTLDFIIEALELNPRGPGL